MKRWLLALTLAALAAPNVAQAQTVGSYPWRTPSTPAISPYLNLNRGGSAGINYFSLVRPQLDAQKNFAQLNAEILQMQAGAAGGFGAGVGGLGTTTGFGTTSGFTGREGGAPVFNSLGHYYPSMPQTGVSPLGRR